MLCVSAVNSPRVHASFDRNWRFHLGDVPEAKSAAFDDGSWRQLDLPHDWSAEADFSPTNASCTGYLPGGIGWYRKTFTTDPAWHGKKVFVTFDGVYRNSKVWINDHFLGERPYGYSTFQYDLTPYLAKQGKNILAVRVERKNVADSRWYPGSGIYRHVWLTVTEPVHVTLWGNDITTPRADTNSADVTIHTEVTNETATAQAVRVVWRLLNPNGEVVSELAQAKTLAAGAGYNFSKWQKVVQPVLWSLDTPKLYTMVSQVFTGQQLMDETRTPFGIRTFYFDANKGFFLNGKNLKLKGVCMHHDGGVVGAAVPRDVLARRLRLLQGIGVNAIRCSHNPMSPELYELCDKMGFLVMDEAFDEWEIGKRKWVEGRNVGTAQRYGYSDYFKQWSDRDCADMVRRDRNHPSVILWSIGNEIDYPTDPYVLSETRTVEGFAHEAKQPQQTRLTVVAPKLIADIKRQDSTRPVTMALANLVSSDATGLAQMLDAVGYNYQEDDYARDHATFPTRVIFGSENGQGFNQWLVVKTNSYISAQFLWVGFDFLGEAGKWPNHGSRSGLFDTRGFKKMSAYEHQAWWTDAPMVALFVAPAQKTRGDRWHRPHFEPQWNWPSDTGHVIVRVISNCEEVQLRLNNQPIASRKPREDCSAFFDVAYHPGKLTAIGFRDGQAVATNRLVTAGPPAALRLTADRKTLPADGNSVANIIVSVVDAQGNLVFSANNEVTADVQGDGRLLGLDNGDQNDPTPLSSHTKKVWGGRALLMAQSGHELGTLQIQVTSPGLTPAKFNLPVTPAK